MKELLKVEINGPYVEEFCSKIEPIVYAGLRGSGSLHLYLAVKTSHSSSIRYAAMQDGNFGPLIELNDNGDCKKIETSLREVYAKDRGWDNASIVDIIREYREKGEVIIGSQGEKL